MYRATRSELRARRRTPEPRALFREILEDGVIFWNFLSPVEVNPGADGILAALDRLRKRGAVR
jgi:hypothetical protein